MAHKVGTCEEHHFACGHRHSKGAHEGALFGRELEGAEFGNERHSYTIFHHSHKGFDAAQVVGALAAASRFELAELHELISETMAFIEQPKGHFSQIVGLH